MKSPLSFARFSLSLLLLVLLSAVSVASAQDQYAVVKDWESFNLAGRTIAPAATGAVSVDVLQLVRGIVFDKHGRVFKDPEIRRFLDSRTWYKAAPGFDNSR